MNDVARADRLRVLALAASDDDAALLYDAFAAAGDEVLSFVDMHAALAASEHALPDLALVDVAMQQGAGLALVHHLKSQSSRIDVYAIASPEALEAGAQAVSLGARAVIVRPLSGDELLNAARAVRESRAVERDRRALVAEVEASRREVAYALRLAALGASERPERLPIDLLALLGEVSGARVAALYEPRPGGPSGALRRKALLGELPDAPAFCDLEGLRALGRRPGHSVVPLTLGPKPVGHLVLGSPHAGGARGPKLSPLLAAQAALVLMSLAAPMADVRGLEALPLLSFLQAGTSLLTTTGAEFGATLAALRPLGDAGRRPAEDEGEMPEPEALLGAARSEGGLAGRGEDGTLFLLFPEFDRLAHHARRRRLWGVLSRAGARPSLGLGVAGVRARGEGALRGALRRALRRAEASEHSPARRPELAALPFAELLDALVWAGSGSPQRPASALQALDLPSADATAVASRALEEVARLGEVSVSVSGRQGNEGGPPTIFGRALATGRPLGLRSMGPPAEGTGTPEALVLYGERGAYALAGRNTRGMFHGVHTSDELLADLIALRLADPRAGGQGG
ncbi:MAG TPA: response regulator [Polyangiaceae bacterium]|nr:response regulator [Polyangiaceae bacterium]